MTMSDSSPKKKEVLFIHQQQHIGGGQTYVNMLSSTISKIGFKVELVESEKTLNILRKILSFKGKTIVWSVYWEFPIGLYLLSWILGKKNIFIMYGVWILEKKSSYWDSGSIKSRFHQKLSEQESLINQFFFCLFSSGIIHLSKYGKKIFLAQPLLSLLRNKKDAIIYGGADQSTFSPISATAKMKLRKKLGVPREAIILLMVGRVEKRKNYIDGLTILSELKKKLVKKDIFLYLVISHGAFNDPVYFEEFLKKAQSLGLGPYLRIISAVSKDSLADFYQLSDAFLMLSTELETFGLVTVEAISSGCPVFGFKTSATPEIITYDQQKYLFRVDQIHQLVSALSLYLRKSSREKQLEVQKIRQENKFLTWDKTIQNISSFFEI